MFNKDTEKLRPWDILIPRIDPSSKPMRKCLRWLRVLLCQRGKACSVCIDCENEHTVQRKETYQNMFSTVETFKNVIEQLHKFSSIQLFIFYFYLLILLLFRFFKKSETSVFVPIVDLQVFSLNLNSQY